MSDNKGNLRQFEVVAFGCHERAHRRLAQFLRSEAGGIHTYLFVEYFCVTPVPFSSVMEKWKKTKLFFPFIRRVVQENQLIWMNKDNTTFELRPKTARVMEEFGDAASFVLRAPDGKIGSNALSYWKVNDPSRKTSESGKANNLPIWSYGTDDLESILTFIKHRKSALDKKVLLREYGLLVQPWIDTKRQVLVFAYPIATPSNFYGYFIVIVPSPEDMGKKKKRELRNKLWHKLKEISDEFYLPVLTILAGSLLEKDISTKIVKAPRGGDLWRKAAGQFMESGGVPFIACAQQPHLQGKQGRCPRCDHPIGADGIAKHEPDCEHTNCPNRARRYGPDVERALHRLWVRRKKMLEDLVDSEDCRRSFLGTLAFGKYFVASPGLITELRKVMTADLRMPNEEGDSLPAALVYGGPGSGKDVLARLVPLLSRHYFFDEIHTINMAGIRPDAITGPLLQGIQLGDTIAAGQKAGRFIGLEGLLIDAKNKLRKGEKSKLREGEKNGPSSAATFILDELNSLDVDLQGILLRILEQGEIMPLFSLTKKYVRHLIVGVVNEDPEVISRESELRDLLLEQGKLGTLISGFLYETFRHTRRLREDLYHRLKRQLYLRVPEMKDRKEDIPMLFYLFALREAKERFKIEDLIVDLDAYRLLMDPRFHWPGNIRQVHAVARSSVDEAHSDSNEPRASLIVSRDHVCKSLRNEFRWIELDCGDGEEEGRPRTDGYAGRQVRRPK